MYIFVSFIFHIFLSLFFFLLIIIIRFYTCLVVQLLSRVWLLPSWTAARQALLSFTISQSLLRLMSIESVMPSNHLILCHHTWQEALREAPAVCWALELHRFLMSFPPTPTPLPPQDLALAPVSACWALRSHCCISVQFSHSVVSDHLLPQGLQHSRLPSPSPTPGVYLNSCPLSRWCHPTISSSVFPFSSCLQSFPASGSFPMSQFVSSDGQNIGASAPMNIQDWFPLGFTGLVSLQFKGFSRVFSNTTVQKHQFIGAQLSLWYSSHIHPYMTTRKTKALTRWTFGGKAKSLLFNMLSNLS